MAGKSAHFQQKYYLHRKRVRVGNPSMQDFLRPTVWPSVRNTSLAHWALGEHPRVEKGEDTDLLQENGGIVSREAGR
eukprot:2422799-Amphidinium_carterae.1